MGGWNKRDVTRLRTQMLKQGRGIDEIAVEIRHLCRCSYLAAYRMAHGLSQPEVVDRYLAIAPDSAIDQPLLSRLEMFPSAGSRTPRATQIITLAGVYGTTPLRLLAPGALDKLDSRERSVVIRCDTAFAQPSHPDDSGNPALITPRPLTVTRPDETPERQLEMAARRSLRFAVMFEGGNLGPETLEQLQAEVSRLARAYQHQPLLELLGDLIDLQDVTFRLLEGRQRPAETRALYVLAGAVSGMLAKASHDLLDPHSAMTQARTAYICADNADHNGLRSWARGLQSLIAYWAGWPNEAVRYAQLGKEPAARTLGTAAVWLSAQEARAWAAVGDADKAEAAIAQADGARDRVRDDDLDALGGILTFPLPRQLYYAADARVWLPGAESQAERIATEAIQAYQEATPEEKSFSDEAGARSDLALARVNSGDLDGGAEALRPVLNLPAEQRIGGVVASVRRVHAALRDPRYRASTSARQMQLEIEAYSQLPAAAALPRGR